MCLCPQGQLLLIVFFLVHVPSCLIVFGWKLDILNTQHYNSDQIPSLPRVCCLSIVIIFICLVIFLNQISSLGSLLYVAMEVFAHLS